jgi:hypothetical protein
MPEKVGYTRLDAGRRPICVSSLPAFGIQHPETTASVRSFMGSFAFAFAFHGVVGVVLARGTTSCLRTNDGAGGDEALAKDLVKKDSDDARYGVPRVGRKLCACV